MEPQERLTVTFTVNGRTYRESVEARTTLADCLREQLGLTGTHLGCEHGVCGACTVLVDGLPVRSCLMLAAQVEGKSVVTVEGLEATGQPARRLMDSFHVHHALQCGFCTPGILTTMTYFLSRQPTPSEEAVREALSGNLCRCTGYQPIIDAVLAAAGALDRQEETP
jgi:aerobic-type carbon monoxide dehydrogenase small subunit (CoxS/CutS family)